jgi:hypothetical protein
MVRNTWIADGIVEDEAMKYSKKTKKPYNEQMQSLGLGVEHLPGMSKGLGSIPGTTRYKSDLCR